MKKLGIAMIGYGGIGPVHMMGYKNIPFHYGLPADTIKLMGVATTNLVTAKKAALEIGCDFWTDNYADLIARDEVDVVDICVPNNAHHEIVLAAAAAGKHIYLEKPLAVTVPEGQQMVEAVTKAGTKNQMTFNFRFVPAITRARQLIDAGFLGNLFSFRGRYYRSSYIDPAKPLSWRLNKEISGGGALFDLGSHILDLIYYLLGDFGSVQAIVDTLIKERPVTAGAQKKVAVEVDDIALMHLRMANGTLGLVEISRMGTGVTNDLQLEIFGDKGALRFNATDPSWLEVYDTQDTATPLGGMRGFRKLETVQRHDGQVSPDWTMPSGFVRSHAECQYRFLKAISDDIPPSPTLADGLKVQQVMAAVLQSSAAGQWVKVANAV